MRSRPAAQGVQTPRLGQVMGEKVASWGGGGHQKDSSCGFFGPQLGYSFDAKYGYGSIPIHTIFRGMNIHLPAILGFTRYQGFDPSPYEKLGVSCQTTNPWSCVQHSSCLAIVLEPSQWSDSIRCSRLELGPYGGSSTWTHPTISRFPNFALDLWSTFVPVRATINWRHGR